MFPFGTTEHSIGAFEFKNFMYIFFLSPEISGYIIIQIVLFCIFSLRTNSLENLNSTPDYNNVIVNNVNIPVDTKHSSQTVLYTATEDCYIIFKHVSADTKIVSDSIDFYINNLSTSVFSIYGWMMYFISAPFKLKTGDVVTFKNDLLTNAYYTVIGVR